MGINYAGMAEQKIGDCLMLALKVEFKVKVTHLGDFSGGAAVMTFGNSGHTENYSLIGEPGDNEIKLYKDETFEYYLYGEKSTEPSIDENGFKFYQDLPLKKGQTLRLFNVSNPNKNTELKLNALYI